MMSTVMTRTAEITPVNSLTLERTHVGVCGSRVGLAWRMPIIARGTDSPDGKLDTDLSPMKESP